TMGAFAKGDEIQVDFKVDPTEIFNKITSRSGLKGELKDDQANRNSLVSIVDLVKAHSDLLRRLFLFLCTMENGVINKSMNCLKAVANGMK
ncbi:hypothetical protein ABTB90_19095, partial [Acinetobacter baumannii]